MKYNIILLAAVLFSLAGMQTYADEKLNQEIRELKWDDLKPRGLEFDDPFKKLSEDQLFNLGTVARYQQHQNNKQKIPDSLKVEYQQALEILKKEAVDIDGLFAKRAEVTEKRRLQAQTANVDLNGKNIRMPGYLLPLEFKDKKVTEFLLVPWVGACIHTPPPPANQIVHVKLAKGFETDGGMYTPVWVNGVMKTENNNPELSYIDGKKNIDVSYVMQADEVENYKK